MKPRFPAAVPEGLLFALLAFGPFAFGGVEPWSAATLEILAFLTALACFLRGREAATPLAAAAWAVPAAAALLGCVQTLSAAAPDAPRPAWPFTAALHETQNAVLLWSAYACVLYSVPRVAVTPAAARRLAGLVFALGLAVTALGFLQAATSADLIYWTRPTTRDVPPFGPYYNHDHAANLIVMGMAVGLGILASQASRWNAADVPPRGDLARAGRLGGALLAMLAAVVFCNSRGALLAASLAGAGTALAAAGFVSGRPRRLGLLAGASASAALVWLCLYAYVHGGAAAGAPMDRSVSARLLIYADSLRWLRDSPLFGTGLGSFPAVFPSYQDQALRASVAHAHSDWLEFLGETGLTGAAAALGAFLLLLGASVRAWHRARSREMRALIGGALAAVLAFAAHSLFEFSFQIPANAVLFWALAGFLLSAPAWADKNERARASSPPAAGPALAGVAVFACAAWAALQPAAAAWSAGRVESPSARLEGLRAAALRDDDPAYARTLARETYRAAVDGRDANPVFLRAAMSYALDAAAARPFDGPSLSLAGSSLWRLNRSADAEALLARAKRVDFSPYWVRRAKDDTQERRRLDALKSLDIVPRAAPAR